MNSRNKMQNSGRLWNWRCWSACRWVALLLGLIPTKLPAQEWTPSDQFLNLVRKIESADGLITVGDHGKSLGAYQMCAAAWTDVSAWRRAQKLATYDYKTAVWDEAVSR